MNWKGWLKGLVAAVIGGAANAVTAVFVAPETFNFTGPGLLATLKMAGAGAFIAFWLYLKQSPLPNGVSVAKVAGTGVSLVGLLWLALAVGCHKQISAPHPGALDNFDSQTYDALLVAQGVLDQATIEFKQGNLPAASKAVINDAGNAYNLARDAWLGYRAVKQAGGSLDKLANATNKVAAALDYLNVVITDIQKLLKKGVPNG